MSSGHPARSIATTWCELRGGSANPEIWLLIPSKDWWAFRCWEIFEEELVILSRISQNPGGDKNRKNKPPVSYPLMKTKFTSEIGRKLARQVIVLSGPGAFHLDWHSR
jgi:hypothetical protein